MKTVNVTFTAPEVQKIVEEAINKLLAPTQRAVVTSIGGGSGSDPRPNQPTHELYVSFEIQER